MEKRNNTRVLFDVNAVLKYDGKKIKCNVVNLSLNGGLFHTEEKIPENADLKIDIIMEGTTSQLTINLEGTVVRAVGSEIGVKFKSMDLDSFVHLKNIVVYNEGDEEKIMQEFYNTVRKTV